MYYRRPHGHRVSDCNLLTRKYCASQLTPNCPSSIIAGVTSQIDPVLVLSGVTKIEHLKQFPYRPFVILGGVYEIPTDDKAVNVIEAGSGLA